MIEYDRWKELYEQSQSVSDIDGLITTERDFWEAVVETLLKEAKETYLRRGIPDGVIHSWDMDKE